jgi:plastocyanin
MMRVVVSVGVFATGGLAWSGLVEAAGKEINATADAAKCDKQWGPPCYTPANGTITPLNVGETITWRVLDGTHTVTPVDPAAFGDSGDLVGPDGTFSVTFDRPGVFAFYCKHHGSVEDDKKTHHGMWGKIDVRGAATSTTAAPPPPTSPPPGSEPPPPEPKPEPRPAPAPTPAPPPPAQHGSSSPPPSNGSSGSGETAAGTGRTYVGPPPPSSSPQPRVAAATPPDPPPTQPPAKSKDDNRSDDKPSEDPEEQGDVTSVPPDELVLPPSPTFSSPTTAPVAEAPEGAPQGDTVAILKSEPGGHRRRLIAIGTVLGVGAFVAGVGGWKWAHRPSKYWPA